MMFKILDQNEDGKVSFNEMSDLLDSIVKIVNDQFDQEYQTMQYQELLNEEERLHEVAK